MVNAAAIVTPAQMRAARAWLGWSQDELSARAGISKRSIARYELGRSVPYTDTLVALQRTFESAGIRFEFVGMIGKGISGP
ncbi:helix-turn-helix domain-containing protein [Tardiphaga sp. 866_E4_N2_3]|uniref:helix-turn-helix domain-containing protein n=2 Tax=Tardiphaga TaxID=1395974 RepID=UPI003F284C82